MRATAVCAAGLLLGGAVGVPVAQAAFGQTATAASTFAAASLNPPSGVVATKRCTLNGLGLVLTAQLDVSWTPSPTTWASAQRVVVTDAGGTVVGTQDVASGVTSTSVGLPLLPGGSYTAVVTSRYGRWSSAGAVATTSGC